MPSGKLHMHHLLLLLLVARDSSCRASANDVGLLWTATGGGWRSMVANSAYAQVFARLGILGGKDGTTPDADDSKSTIDTVATTSGSSWWSAQFFFSEQYYYKIVNGTPASLGEFTQEWFAAYASTQENITLSCPKDSTLEELCLKLSQDDPYKEVLYFISLAQSFNYSWPNVVYSMYEAASATFDDLGFVNVQASGENKLSQLDDIDVCFHTSLLPNARAREAKTMTYLAEDVNQVNSSYTVPLPHDWCVSNNDSGWYAPFPGGNVYSPAPDEFAGSTAYSGFPLYPPPESATLYTSPEMINLTGSIEPEGMSPPFGGIPTAVQISTASSSNVGYLSEELASYFAQYMSLWDESIKTSSSYTEVQKIEIRELLQKAQNYLWTTGLLANAATNSAWTKPNPVDMPGGDETSYWFTDGGYTDGPSAATAIARYQKMHGTDGLIKLIVSNNNYRTNNMNNILAYFPTSWNDGVHPGDFVWGPSVGSGPNTNPQRSNEIFEEYLDADSLNEMLKPINGTKLTMATLSATTVANGAYGTIAGQKVSILLLNLNSDIPTILITAPIINGYTPDAVSMVESIASSKELEEVVNKFVGGGKGSSPTPADDASKSPHPAPTSMPTSDGIEISLPCILLFLPMAGFGMFF